MYDKSCEELAEHWINDLEENCDHNLNLFEFGRLRKKLAQDIQDTIESFIEENNLDT